MKNIKAFTGSLESYSLSNFIHNSNCDAAEFKLALEETKKAGDFVRVANQYTGLGWRVVKNTDEIVQIQMIDRLGNKRYIRAEKTDSKLNVLSIEQLEKIINGLEKTGEKCRKYNSEEYTKGYMDALKSFRFIITVGTQ